MVSHTHGPGGAGKLKVNPDRRGGDYPSSRPPPPTPTSAIVPQHQNVVVVVVVVVVVDVVVDVVVVCDNILSGYLCVVTTVFSQQDGIYGFKFPKRFLEISSRDLTLFSTLSLILI